MTRNLRTLSVALILVLGPGTPATSLHADSSAASVSAGPLSYIRLSDAATGSFGTVTHLPRAPTNANYNGTHDGVGTTLPMYRPPIRGAPATRIGGGSRGVDGAGWTLSVLAPDHTGHTSQSSPTLYWYTSQAVSGQQTEITLIKQGAEDPVLETTLHGTVGPGIQRLDLSRWGVELEIDAEYAWFVSIVRNRAQRSMDFTAGGTIQQVVLPPGVQARVAGSDARTVPFIYADQGIWYDAIDTLSRLIQANPADDTLRHQRAALLRQEGLETTIADRGDDDG